MGLKIERLESGAVTVLRLAGDLDEVGKSILSDALMGCLQDRRCKVVVNMADVKYVSYLGVGVLVERLRQLRLYGGDMKLAGVNTYTDRLFRMLGVTRVFETHDAEGVAIQMYQRAA